MSNVSRLPGPIAELWDWQLRGACRGWDSAQFFHPDGDRRSSRSRREAKAKSLCEGCPVRGECAAHALAAREPYGIWGGFTEAERLRLLAVGWEDAADLRRRRVDVRKLEARLGLRLPRAPCAESAHVHLDRVPARGSIRLRRGPPALSGDGDPPGPRHPQLLKRRVAGESHPPTTRQGQTGARPGGPGPVGVAPGQRPGPVRSRGRAGGCARGRGRWRPVPTPPAYPLPGSPSSAAGRRWRRRW